MGRGIRRIIFLDALLSKGDLSPFCRKVTNTITGKVIYCQGQEQPEIPSKATFFVRDVPGYLDLEIPDLNNKSHMVSIPTYQGYTIQLHAYADCDAYLNSRVSASGRSKLRRYQRKLETCFPIRYQTYYGSIQKTEYDRLFAQLRVLIERRFFQKREHNYDLQYLDYFQDTVYPLILEKRASLFVIYDDKKPISIRLNMHYEKIIYSLITSYDIDYGKFGLGSIDMVKNIEWGFDQGFEIIDLLKGYYYHKKKWITEAYNYRHLVIYGRNSLPTYLGAYYIKLKMLLFYRLVKLGRRVKLDKVYKRYKTYRYGRSIQSKRNRPTKFVGALVECSNGAKNCDVIQIETGEYAFVREAVYDYLYRNNCRREDVRVTKCKESKGDFCVHRR